MVKAHENLLKILKDLHVELKKKKFALGVWDTGAVLSMHEGNMEKIEIKEDTQVDQVRVLLGATSTVSSTSRDSVDFIINYLELCDDKQPVDYITFSIGSADLTVILNLKYYGRYEDIIVKFGDLITVSYRNVILKSFRQVDYSLYKFIDEVVQSFMRTERASFRCTAMIDAVDLMNNLKDKVSPDIHIKCIISSDFADLFVFVDGIDSAVLSMHPIKETVAFNVSGINVLTLPMNLVVGFVLDYTHIMKSRIIRSNVTISNWAAFIQTYLFVSKFYDLTSENVAFNTINGIPSIRIDGKVTVFIDSTSGYVHFLRDGNTSWECCDELSATQCFTHIFGGVLELPKEDKPTDVGKLTDLNMLEVRKAEPEDEHEEDNLPEDEHEEENLQEEETDGPEDEDSEEESSDEDDDRDDDDDDSEEEDDDYDDEDDEEEEDDDSDSSDDEDDDFEDDDDDETDGGDEDTTVPLSEAVMMFARTFGLFKGQPSTKLDIQDKGDKVIVSWPGSPCPVGLTLTGYPKDSSNPQGEWLFEATATFKERTFSTAPQSLIACVHDYNDTLNELTNCEK